jgi:hypothetical protein
MLTINVKYALFMLQQLRKYHFELNVNVTFNIVKGRLISYGLKNCRRNYYVFQRVNGRKIYSIKRVQGKS